MIRLRPWFAGTAIAASMLFVPALGVQRAVVGGQVVATQAVLPAAPLSSSVEVGGASWAVVAMGKLGDPSDTFWQLVVRRAGAARWTLVTPPGVADNGGLVMVGAGATLLSGFEPSQDLRFSPVASSTDAGAKWSPGVIPEVLTRVPDALALTTTSTAYALVGEPARGIVSSVGDRSSWRSVATLPMLAASSPRSQCRVSRLDAVATTLGGGVLVGVGCATTGGAGVLHKVGSSWDLAPVVLPAAQHRAQGTVLRLSTTAGGISGLLEAGLGAKRWLFAMRSGASGTTYTLSPAVALSEGETLTSSGLLSDGGLFVLLHGPSGTRAEVLEPNGARSLPSLPAGTATLAFGSGRVDALAAQGSTLTDYVLEGVPGHWVSEQTLEVPIQFGSSG